MASTRDPSPERRIHAADVVSRLPSTSARWARPSPRLRHRPKRLETTFIARLAHYLTMHRQILQAMKLQPTSSRRRCATGGARATAQRAAHLRTRPRTAPDPTPTAHWRIAHAAWRAKCEVSHLDITAVCVFPHGYIRLAALYTLAIFYYILQLLHVYSCSTGCQCRVFVCRAKP